ncbi:hypothetical protein [Marinobacterium jannaschii]|uniref:hypothetical protein n=1 Tax=Marinobacterium jannaschii TaxID=64970 RepID=UPI000A57DCE9|nr:hypothetical protein [Marinobacterium jannaschii]
MSNKLKQEAQKALKNPVVRKIATGLIVTLLGGAGIAVGPEYVSLALAFLAG